MPKSPTASPTNTMNSTPSLTQIQLPHPQGRLPPLRLPHHLQLQTQNRLPVFGGSSQKIQGKVLDRRNPQRQRLRYERWLFGHLQNKNCTSPKR